MQRKRIAASSRTNQTRRKASRTHASLLIDWTPPRVWIETLEARTLLSVNITPDTEVREGYFRWWGSGSIVDQNDGHTLWGNSKGYSGPIATFWGDVPDVTRVFVGVRPWPAWDEEQKPIWTRAAIVDVPGPTFEVHATLVAPADEIDEPLAADVVFVNDRSGQNIVKRSSASVLFSDKHFITISDTHSDLYVQRGLNDTNRLILEVRQFFDRLVSRDTHYSVDIDWQDGSPAETHLVNGWYWGAFGVELEHALRAGTTPRVTVWDADRTESFSITPKVHLPYVPTTRPTPPHADGEEDTVPWKWMPGAAFPDSEPVTSVGELWTKDEKTDDLKAIIGWDREYHDISDATTLTPLGLKIDPDTGRIWHAYRIDIAPRKLLPGTYYPTIYVNEGGKSLGYSSLISVNVAPSTLTYLSGFVVPPEDPMTLWLTEGLREPGPYYGNGVDLMDSGTHVSSDYRGWFEFTDGTRAPISVGEVFPVEGHSRFSVEADFALWSSSGKPVASLPWEEKFNYTGNYESFSAALHVERDGAAMDLPMEIRLGAGNDWLVANPANTLAALGLPAVAPLQPEHPTANDPPLADVPPVKPATPIDPALVTGEVEAGPQDVESQTVSELPLIAIDLSDEPNAERPLWASNFFGAPDDDLLQQLPLEA